MRKFIAIPLLMLYIIAVSGTMVQIHFCGSKVSSWKINEEHASCCCSKEEPVSTAKGMHALSADDDCCSSKVVTLKIAQDQNKESKVLLQLSATDAFVAVQPRFTIPLFTGLHSEETKDVYQSNAPPGLWQNIPLYKLHARFTYYG